MGKSVRASSSLAFSNWTRRISALGVRPSSQVVPQKPKRRKPRSVRCSSASIKATWGSLDTRRFKADNPNVLIFDAGQFVYVTDSREENRTTLEFTLESTTDQDYRCTYLAQDATPVEVEPVTEEVPGGWRKKFVLFAGCSALLEARTP